MKFTVRHNDREDLRTIRTIKGAIQALEVDFAPWADDNGALTSATWSVLSGNATISSTALASSSATATLTTADEGNSVIEVKGINASYTQPIRIRVYAKSPQAFPVNDYGFYG